MVAIALPTTTTTTPVRHRWPVEATGAGSGPRRLAHLVVAAVAAIALVAALVHLAGTPAPAPGQAVSTYVAAEGDTMWSIATAHARAGEAATYVESLVAANGGATVVPGQAVALPVP